MKLDKTNSSNLIKKIIFMMIILIILLTAGVVATGMNLHSVKISFDDSDIIVMTAKTKVADILEENKIVLLDNEYVYPSMDDEIDFTKTITISKEEKEQIVLSELEENVSTEEILGNYVTIVEKIVIVEEEIPFETVTKDVSNSGTETEDRVIQEGQNGLKKSTYKVKYQNEVEIDRILISEEIVRQPVEKIIQISTKVVNRSSARNVNIGASSSAIANSVAGKEPSVVTMNVSAYTASTCGKAAGSSGYGKTASGVMASAWCTVAAGKGYPMGTVIYIPYFANKPNGGWFVVQDRGGAISNSRLDIYMDTYQDCINFGRRNLECYVY